MHPLDVAIAILFSKQTFYRGLSKHSKQIPCICAQRATNLLHTSGSAEQSVKQMEVCFKGRRMHVCASRTKTSVILVLQ